jgi:hypothetical protein
MKNNCFFEKMYTFTQILYEKMSKQKYFQKVLIIFLQTVNYIIIGQ